VVVDDPAVERLESLVYPTNSNAREDNQVIGLDILVENTGASCINSILTLPRREFVEAFSRINIVCNITI